MKRYLLIIAMLLGAVCSWGQSANDQSAVLQKCIALPQVVKYFQFDPTGVPANLFAVQGDATIPAISEANYFGKKLEVVTLDQVVSRRGESFFTFNRFEVSQNSAIVSYNFCYNYSSGRPVIQIDLELKKTGNEWIISNTKETRR